MKRVRFVLWRILVPIVLVGLAYTSGWYAYPLWHPRAIRFNASIRLPMAVPRGYGAISFPQTAETASFVVGDRADVLADYDGSMRPVVIDALVIENTKMFSLMIPWERREMFPWAEHYKRMKLHFRKTRATDATRYDEEFGSEDYKWRERKFQESLSSKKPPSGS